MKNSDLQQVWKLSASRLDGSVLQTKSWERFFSYFRKVITVYGSEMKRLIYIDKFVGV